MDTCNRSNRTLFARISPVAFGRSCYRFFAYHWRVHTAVVAGVAAICMLMISAGTYALFFAASPQPTSASSVNLQSGLVGYWPLNGNAKDSTPYAHDGTISGTVTPAADRNGVTNGALNFGGTGSITIGSNPAFTHSLPFTVSTWVNGTSPTYAQFVNKYTSGSWNGFNLLAVAGGKVCAYYMTGTTSNNYTAIASDNGVGSVPCPVIPSGWHLLTVTVSTSGMVMYVDGSSAATSGWTGTAKASTETTPMTFGTGSYSGSMDDVRIYSRGLNTSEIKALSDAYQPGVYIDGLRSGLISYWPLDNDAKDNTPYGNNGTAANVTATADRFGTSSGAYSFNGTSSYINMGNVDNMGTGSLTVSAWFKTTQSTASITNRTIVAKSLYGTQVGRYSINQGNGMLQGMFADGSGAGHPVQTSETPYIDGNWHLMTMVYDRAGLASLYIDGVLKASASMSAYSSVNMTSSDNLYIGVYNDASGKSPMSGTYFNGSIDDVRIYNRALSAQQVLQLYASGGSQINLGGSGSSTTSSINLTKGLISAWLLDGNAKDSTPYSHNGTVNGATPTTDRFNAVNSAYSFNGTNSYINMGNVDNMGTGSLTVSAWFKTTQSSSSIPLHAIVAKSMYGAQAGRYYILQGNGMLQGVFAADSTAGQIVQTSETPYIDGAWHLITMVYNRTGSESLYVDGVLKNSADISSYSSANMITSDNLYIGAYNDVSGTGVQSGSYFNGSIDDVRVYNRALSAAEVAALYNLAD